MIMPVTVSVSASELLDFIHRSKKQCFAKSDKKTSLTDQSSVYSHRDLPWCYTDHYKGNHVERGTEDVSFNMRNVWSMQYRGGYHSKFFPLSEQLSRALKFSLLHIPKEFPVRGPKRLEFTKEDVPQLDIPGNFVYTNNWEGDIACFTGRESLQLNGEEVFYHDYIGGANTDKFYPVEIIE